MKICVVGAGQMGAGIAQWLSSKGVNVLLRELEILLYALVVMTVYITSAKRALAHDEKYVPAMIELAKAGVGVGIVPDLISFAFSAASVLMASDACLLNWLSASMACCL